MAVVVRDVSRAESPLGVYRIGGRLDFMLSRPTMDSAAISGHMTKLDSPGEVARGARSCAGQAHLVRNRRGSGLRMRTARPNVDRAVLRQVLPMLRLRT